MLTLNHGITAKCPVNEKGQFIIQKGAYDIVAFGKPSSRTGAPQGQSRITSEARVAIREYAGELSARDRHAQMTFAQGFVSQKTRSGENAIYVVHWFKTESGQIQLCVQPTRQAERAAL